MYSIAGVGAVESAVVQLEAAAADLAAVSPAGDAAQAALEQADRLLRVADLVSLAVEERVRVVDSAGQAKTCGHASTTAWLRNGGPHAAGPVETDDGGAAGDIGPAEMPDRRTIRATQPPLAQPLPHRYHTTKTQNGRWHIRSTNRRRT